MPAASGAAHEQRLVLLVGRQWRGRWSWLPDGGQEWELVFEPQVLGSGPAIYTITAADIAED